RVKCIKRLAGHRASQVNPVQSSCMSERSEFTMTRIWREAQGTASRWHAGCAFFGYFLCSPKESDEGLLKARKEIGKKSQCAHKKLAIKLTSHRKGAKRPRKRALSNRRKAA
ncbi:MAG: hypothetical protein ACWA5Q_03885, partial [bacterium]